ncbi:MAG TPA: DUF4340 domain-containing protein, partial [Stellaceae bacterium]|nr:DUF4340 domain-containing protein [Stellaceae bacterium]
VAAVVAAVVASREDLEASRTSSSSRALPGFADKLDQLAYLRLSRGATTVNFKRSEGRWVVAEKGNYPADQERLRKLLVQLAQLELVEPKTDKPELLARLDLDDPANGKSTDISARDRVGAVVGQIIIGRQRPSEIAQGETGVYVCEPGSDRAWLARGAFELGGDARSWLDRQIIDLPPARISSVVMTAPDGSSVIVSRKSADLPFVIDSASTDARPRPDAALAAPAGALEALNLDDVKPVAEQPIPPDGVATAAFTTLDGLIVGIRLSAPESGDWAAISATGFGDGEAEAQKLNARLAQWSFAIPPTRAKLMRTTLSDLLLPGGS